MFHKGLNPRRLRPCGGNALTGVAGVVEAWDFSIARKRRREERMEDFACVGFTVALCLIVFWVLVIVRFFEYSKRWAEALERLVAIVELMRLDYRKSMSDAAPAAPPVASKSRLTPAPPGPQPPPMR